MRAIPFTQYLMPYGRKSDLNIEVSDAVADKADSILAMGLAFECEMLRTGDVSVTITHPENGDLDIRVTPNGPGIREAVEDLILNFSEVFI